jgi:NDP-sugar pyrophosphorylase family protein
MNRAVILAGGKGSRLSPYTSVIPKPLLPVGDHAILEIVVRQLRAYGFDELTFATGYLAHLIQAVFDDGARHGVSIEYHHEEEPLGTAGALGTMERFPEPFLMMNGDVLTSLDYRRLYNAHVASGNALTIASHRRIVSTDYGVLHLDGARGETNRVVGYEEKPEIPYVVSMGVYVVSPVTYDFITPGAYLDVPDLVVRLMEAGETVGSYIYDGYWLDIGRHEDYQQATDDFERLGPRLLPFSDYAGDADAALPGAAA